MKISERYHREEELSVDGQKKCPRSRHTSPALGGVGRSPVRGISRHGSFDQPANRELLLLKQ